MNYFVDTHFSQSAAAMRVVNDPLDRLGGNLREIELEKDLTTLDTQIFAFQAGTNTWLGTVFLGYLLLLTMLTIAIPPESSGGAAVWPGPLLPAIFGLLVLAAYLLMPDHLGGGEGGLPNGGFLKARLALVPPLLWLACVREPRFLIVRLILRIGIVALLGTNLWFVNSTVQKINGVLTQYTAGIDAVGHGHRLIAVQSPGWPSPYANPLLHAVDYYCLGTNNVNLDNYEAMMPHFPVKYRAGLSRGRVVWGGGQNGIDTMICWQSNGGPPGGWEEIFHEGPLRIYRRPGD
jgi:hypothetical protein